MSGRLIVVAGPTATGKTRLGIELARRLDGEILSADSMQLYRGMDIGTAKATKEEQAAAPHHMLDVADPSETYSVARYVDEAGQVCDDILSRGQVPILVSTTYGMDASTTYSMDALSAQRSDGLPWQMTGRTPGAEAGRTGGV